MQQVASPAMATARNYSAMSTAASMNYRDLPQNQTAWAQMAHGNQMGVGAQQWQPQQRRTPSENEMQVQPPTVDQMLAKLMSKMTVKRTEQPMGGATPPAFFPQPVQMQPAPRMQRLYLEQKFNSEPPRAPVFGAYPQGPAYGGYGPPARHGHPLDGCMYNSDPPANYRQVDTRQFASDPPMTATFSRPLLQQGMSPTRYHLDALLQSRTALGVSSARCPFEAVEGLSACLSLASSVCSRNGWVVKRGRQARSRAALSRPHPASNRSTIRDWGAPSAARTSVSGFSASKCARSANVRPDSNKESLFDMQKPLLRRIWANIRQACTN